MGFHLLALRCLELLLRQSSRVLLSSRREELPSSNCVCSLPSLCKHQAGLGFQSAPNLSFKSAFNLISMHRFSLSIHRSPLSLVRPACHTKPSPPTNLPGRLPPHEQPNMDLVAVPDFISLIPFISSLPYS